MVNWDDWQQLSDEGKAVMLEYHRENRKMEAWEIKERDRKANLK